MRGSRFTAMVEWATIGWVVSLEDSSEELGTAASLRPVPSDAAQVYAQGEGYRVVQWRNVFLSRWFGPISIEGLEACEAGSFDLASRTGTVVVLNVIAYGLAIPSSDVRKKASAIVHATANHVEAAAMVLPGEGFWVSTARAAVATITLLSRAGHPSRVFAHAEDAARFLLPRVRPKPATLPQIERALDRLTQADEPPRSS